MQNRAITLQYCPTLTEVMLADLFTKPLGKGRFEALRSAMGLEIC